MSCGTSAINMANDSNDESNTGFIQVNISISPWSQSDVESPLHEVPSSEWVLKFKQKLMVKLNISQSNPGCSVEHP